MGLEGDLRDLGLPSLLQMLCVEGRRFGVRIQRDGQEGCIFVDRGEVVHAALGGVEGDEAVHRLLRWPDGTFSVGDPAEVPRKTVETSWTHLVLEEARMFDEATREPAAAKTGSLSLADLESDDTLENDLIELLGRLEQYVNKLLKGSDDPSQCLRLLEEAVNQVIATAESALKTDPERGALVRVLLGTRAQHPQLRLVHTQKNRVSLVTLGKLYRSWSEDMAERARLFRDVSTGLAAIVESYFSIFSGSFNSTTARQEWQDTNAVFLAELREALACIRF